DKARTMPPVNLTPDEAVAMAVALKRMDGTPFRVAGGSALRKLLAAMRPADVAAAQSLAGRIHLLDGGQVPPGVPGLVADALTAARVLRIRYRDRADVVTAREIEPLGYVCRASHWYLVAWCRRRDAVRAFRTDRIFAVTVTA